MTQYPTEPIKPAQNASKVPKIEYMADKYQSKIIKALQEAGIYTPALNPLIEVTASRWRTLDQASKEVEAKGMTYDYIDTCGHTMLRENPLLAIMNKASDDLAALFRQLGISHHHITSAAREEEGPCFDDALVDAALARTKTEVFAAP